MKRYQAVGVARAALEARAPLLVVVKRRLEAEAKASLLTTGTVSGAWKEVLKKGYGKRPGPKRYDRKGRDLAIAEAVAAVTQLGFRPTRGEATKDSDSADSACSIVASAIEAMHKANEFIEVVNEADISKIWSKAPAWIRNDA